MLSGGDLTITPGEISIGYSVALRYACALSKKLKRLNTAFENGGDMHDIEEQCERAVPEVSEVCS